jgi:hypothetical protein
MKTDILVLTDDDAPVSALLFVIIKTYGTACFEWESVILRNELETDFDIKLTDLQSDKIQAGITILTTDMYESDIRTFEVCSSLFNCSAQDFEDFEPLEAEELITALTEIMMLKMENLEFSQEVNAYAGEVFFNYGFCNTPKLFPTAIMPEGKPKVCDDLEKNEALQEIFDARIKSVKAYLEDMVN